MTIIIIVMTMKRKIRYDTIYSFEWFNFVIIINLQTNDLKNIIIASHHHHHHIAINQGCEALNTVRRLMFRIMILLKQTRRRCRSTKCWLIFIFLFALAIFAAFYYYLFAFDMSKSTISSTPFSISTILLKTLITLHVFQGGSLVANASRSRASSDECTTPTLSVYYEALCPDSLRFIVNQLYPTYTSDLHGKFKIDLNPFGNADIIPPSGGSHLPSFRCQHGPRECRGNLIHVSFVSFV